MLRLFITIITVFCVNTTCRDVVIVNLGKTSAKKLKRRLSQKRRKQTVLPEYIEGSSD